VRDKAQRSYSIKGTPMISLPLDPKKMLGFKLIPLTPVDPHAVISMKQGSKTVIQLGAKVGAKAGSKNMSPAPRD
jgi:hypothetical protein